MGMPRATEKNKRPPDVGGKVIVSSGTQKGNLGGGTQYNQSGPKNTAPNYIQLGKAKSTEKC
jgi:hypothetical protein